MDPSELVPVTEEGSYRRADGCWLDESWVESVEGLVAAADGAQEELEPESKKPEPDEPDLGEQREEHDSDWDWEAGSGGGAEGAGAGGAPRRSKATM